MTGVPSVVAATLEVAGPYRLARPEIELDDLFDLDVRDLRAEASAGRPKGSEIVSVTECVSCVC